MKEKEVETSVESGGWSDEGEDGRKKELIAKAIKVNPFDVKFREANRKMSRTLGDDEPGAPPTSSALETPAIQFSPPVSAGGGTEKAGVSRKASGSGSGLSLKLPPTLTSQSPGLFSNISMLEDPGGIDTPEIARLLNLYDGKGNPPRTAEVLNAVLDIATQPRKASAPSNLLNTPPQFTEASEMCGEPGTRGVSSPPTLGNGNEEDGVPGNQGGLPPQSFPNAEGGGNKTGGGGLMLSVRLGGPSGQLVNIPVELGLTANKVSLEQSLDKIVQPDTPNQAVVSASAMIQSDCGLPNMISRKCGAVSEPPVSVGKSECVGQGGDPLEKRTEIMERNKAAAVRYRKRKKEEFEVLQQKVGKLEEEKLELSTKVLVLQRELDRISRRMDAHRSCTCRCEEAPETGAGEVEDINVERLSPPPPSKAPPPSRPLIHQVVSGSYVLQPILTAFPGSQSGPMTVVGSPGSSQFNLVPMVPLSAKEEVVTSTPSLTKGGPA